MHKFVRLGWGILGLALIANALANEVQPVSPLSKDRLSLVNLRNLRFAPAFQGDGAEMIPPLRGGAENSALFMIQGRPYLAVVVLIPDDTVVLTTTSRERGAKSLSVRRMRTLPEAGQPFQLNAKGSAEVAVGGTRDSVAANQAAGNYDGRFFVTVMYQ